MKQDPNLTIFCIMRHLHNSNMAMITYRADVPNEATFDLKVATCSPNVTTWGSMWQPEFSSCIYLPVYYRIFPNFSIFFCQKLVIMIYNECCS